MNIAISPLYLMPGLLGGTLCVWMALFSARRRPGIGWRYLVATGTAVAAWCFGQLAWVLGATEVAVLRAAQFQYVAIVFASVLWLLHALAQSGLQGVLHSRWLLLLGIVPLATVGITLGHPEGGESLMWRGFLLPPEVPVPQALRGPFFWVFMGHTYALLLAGCGILLRYYAQSSLYRAELLVTGAFPALLLVLNALYLSGNWPLPLDPTPLGFGLGFFLFGWAMERRRLFQIRPVGWRVAFESLREGILIADCEGRVIELNSAAARLLGYPEGVSPGRSLAEVLPLGAGCGESRATIELDLQLHPGASASRVQIDSSPIVDGSGLVTGTVFALRDVTRERTAQQQLLAAHGHLRKLNADLQRLAQIDPLTGLANRRVLIERLEQEFARARRYATPLALLLIDLDHFKRVNDNRGHLAGDAVLRTIGSALEELTRPADLAARYGGEELVLLLTETEEDGARHAAERVWKCLRGIEHPASGGGSFRVTASIGLASLRGGDANPESLIARADAALYAAKNAGRDRIALALDSGFRVYQPGSSLGAGLSGL